MKIEFYLPLWLMNPEKRLAELEGMVNTPEEKRGEWPTGLIVRMAKLRYKVGRDYQGIREDHPLYNRVKGVLTKR